MMIQLLSGLDQDKYEFYIASKSDGELVEAVRQKNWEHIAIDSLVRELSWKDIVSTWRIMKIIQKIKPDIVHTHSAKTGFLGRIIARLMGVRLVIHTVHGFPFHQYQHPVKRFFYIILEMFAGLFAHYNIFVNKFEKEYAIHRLGYNRKKCVTVYNGVSRFEVRGSRFEIGGMLKIVSVLRFTEQKNVVTTIEQAIRVVGKYEGVCFDFFGGGELFEICEKIVLDSGVGDRVCLKGWVSNVQEILIGYDVFLLHSLWEGLPISILEAMNVGLPVICSDIKGNNELVDSLNGWLIDPKDKNGIDNVVGEILNDKSILREKGVESFKKVTNRFNYELFINEYERLYSTILTQRTQR